MTDITIPPLPYVNDATPNTGVQFPIDWIKNGEALNGSKLKYGTDGTLNRVTAQLQSNIEALQSNDNNIAIEVNGLSTALDKLNSDLGTIDTPLITRVGVLETEYTSLNTTVVGNTTNIATNTTNISAIKTDIGTIDPTKDSVYRTVRNDIQYVKEQVGNYTGQDINGQTVANNPSSGVKNKLESITSETISNTNRIETLESFDISNMGDKLETALTESVTFATGGILNSIRELITDGKYLYYWTGAFPLTVTAGSTPNTLGIGTDKWNQVGSNGSMNTLASSTGWDNVGQASSYQELQQIVPVAAGQKILLISYTDDWKTSNKSPKGGGQFVACANTSSVSDNGGSICLVNSSWYWRRIVDKQLSPEMFGAAGDGSKDDAPAIRSAINASYAAGLDDVKGDGIYQLGSPIYMISGYHPPLYSGMSYRQGASLHLNIVIVNPDLWPDVPDKFWNAQGVFVPPGNIEIESYNLYVNEMNCGGKAHAISSTYGAINTSRLQINHLRNYVIGFKNHLGQIFSSGMNKVYGNNWQNGYIGVLQGGTGNGAGNGECAEFNITWCSNHKYTGISLQDRSQYADVKGGTYDYNGKEASLLSLSSISSNNAYVIQFGDTLTIGTKTCYAMSSLMNNNGTWCVLVTEDHSTLDGTSSYSVGDSVSNSTTSFTATISSIRVTSAANPSYFDVVISNRTGDFSKCNVMMTYGGGVIGHNLFTNTIICPNSVNSVEAMNLRGLGIAGGSSTSFWYLQHLYGTSPIFEFYSDRLKLDKNLQMGTNSITGVVSSIQAIIGSPVTLYTFATPDSGVIEYYEVIVGSSITAQYARLIIRVSNGGAVIIEKASDVYINSSIASNSFALISNISGSNAILTTRVLKR